MAQSTRLLPIGIPGGKGLLMGVHVSTDVERYLYLDTAGNIHRTRLGYSALIDGVIEPSQVAGYARIFVDITDGHLKIKFADGSVWFLSGGNIKTVTTDYTLVVSDETVWANGTSLTITLPPAANANGLSFSIKNMNSTTATLDGDGSETIDGATTQSLLQYDAIKVISDGTQWGII